MIDTKSVLAYGLEETAVILNRGFSDYFVPINFTLNSLLNMVAHDGLDLSSSRIAFKNGEPVGAGLIARRGWSSRLAGMAIVPEAQNQGIGKQFMKVLVTDAKERGDHRMELEVIAANTPGIKLYESAGFRTMRQLFSYKLESPPLFQTSNTAIEIDIREVARQVTLNGYSDLPWQLSGETIAGFTPPYQAYRLDKAFVVLTNPENETIHIRSLIVNQSARNQGQATQLLHSLFTRFPGKTWNVPAIFPEELGPLFETLGFKRGELSQWQMALDIRE
ncbi:MAG: GNAT family N-acetyltransferase [Chloroflexi bacterium]|nr:MAG: GNAT family N-acetyltransferase [Chloroflexota bacterium]